MICIEMPAGRAFESDFHPCRPERFGIFHVDCRISRTTGINTTMTSENSSETVRKSTSTVPFPIDLEFRRPELQVLLQRCRDNLETMDSLLSGLDRARESLSSTPQTERKIPPLKTEAVVNSPSPPKSTGFGGDSIRRMASDIESLCQSSASADAREMLNLIQSRMARCLQLIPSMR